MRLKRFFTELLTMGGYPVTKDNLNGFMKWESCEGTSADYNPLATTLKMPGSTDFNDNGGVPVQNYVSRDQGVKATLITIRNGYYEHIVMALKLGTLGSSIRASGVIRDELDTWGSGGWCVATQLGGIIK